MIVNYWSTDDWIVDQDRAQKDDAREAVLLKKLLSLLGERRTHLNSIEIETINRCNNDCSFCPVSKKNDVRKMLRMEESVFRKIIDELHEMNYQGFLSLFSNNEPLIDDRIYWFISYAREKLPNATHAMYTNGILLTEEKYRVLLDNLDYLVIDNYNDNMELNENIRALYEKKIDDKGCLVKVDVRRKNQILMNRGGLSPNNQSQNLYNSPCLFPFFQMVIRPDGKISRCCQDAYGNETMGDVSCDRIEEIWKRGEKYTAYRSAMLEGRRRELSFCRNCDITGLTNYFPYEWLALYNQIRDEVRMDKLYGSLVMDGQLPLAIRLIGKSKRKEMISRIQKANIEGKLVIWGAGNNLRCLLEILQITPRIIFDTNKAGEIFDGVRIGPPNNLMGLAEYIFLITPNNGKPIIERLREAGVREENMIEGCLLLGTIS